MNFVAYSMLDHKAYKMLIANNFQTPFTLVPSNVAH